MSKLSKIVLTVLIVIIGGTLIVTINVGAETGSHPVGISVVVIMAAIISGVWKYKPKSEKEKQSSKNDF